MGWLLVPPLSLGRDDRRSKSFQSARRRCYLSIVDQNRHHMAQGPHSMHQGPSQFSRERHWRRQFRRPIDYKSSQLAHSIVGDRNLQREPTNQSLLDEVPSTLSHPYALPITSGVGEELPVPDRLYQPEPEGHICVNVALREHYQKC